MKEKGIWNCYKGAVRADIQKYCEINNINEEEFCFIDIYKWRDVYEQVAEHFVIKKENYKKGLHWLNTNGIFREDKIIQYSFDSRGKEEWIFKLPELVERTKEKVYLLMEEGKKFWICEGYLPIISEIIYEKLRYVDYYIVDKKYNWMITKNHHDIVLFVGQGLVLQRIFKIL